MSEISTESAKKFNIDTVANAAATPKLSCRGPSWA